jgi:hypothetical protein
LSRKTTRRTDHKTAAGGVRSGNPAYLSVLRRIVRFRVTYVAVVSGVGDITLAWLGYLVMTLYEMKASRLFNVGRAKASKVSLNRLLISIVINIILFKVLISDIVMEC